MQAATFIVVTKCLIIYYVIYYTLLAWGAYFSTVTIWKY